MAGGTDVSVQTVLETDPALMYQPAYPAELMDKAEKDPNFSGTMQEIADFFQVSRATVCSWCCVHPAFGDAVTQVQDSRNDRIAHLLYRAASGYTYQERKIIRDKDGFKLKEEIYEKYMPENINAIRLWLINRNSRDWKAKPEETVAASVTINLVNNIEEFR